MNPDNAIEVSDLTEEQELSVNVGDFESNCFPGIDVRSGGSFETYEE